MLSIFKSFLPWILYSILYSNNPTQFKIAIGAAIGSSLLLDWKDLRAGFILTWCTLLYFAGLLIFVTLYHSVWLEKNMWLFSNLILATIAFLSILIKKPFTIQYAKQAVAEAYWNNPLFIEINNILTLIWGLIFLFTALTNYLHSDALKLHGIVYFFVNNIGWVIGAYASKKFPDYWKKRALSRLARKK